MTGPREQEQADLGGVVQGFLGVLPPFLTETVRAAAVPHRFDADVLSTLLDVDAARAANLIRKLREVPFVQALGREEGEYTLHEMVRDYLLDELWQEGREKYVAWSRRVAVHFQERKDEIWQLEALYHWLIADPEQGVGLIQRRGAEWIDTFRYGPVETLVQLGLEHDMAGRLAGRARGWIYLRKGQMRTRYFENREALENLEVALGSGEGDRQLEANCMEAMGDVHWMLDEYALARGRYEEALSIYQEIGDQLREAKCTRRLGDVHRLLDEYTPARKWYEEALSIYQEIGDRLGEANCVRRLGDVHRMLDEYAPAREQYEEALSIYQEIDSQFGEANCIYRLGNVHWMLDEYALARERYWEALSIYRKIGDRLGEANCILGLGDAHRMLDEYTLAQERYKEALLIYREIGSRLGEANCILELGDVHRMLNEYAPARKRYEEALSIYREIGSRLGEANCVKTLGDMHRMLAEYTLARERYEEALSIYREIGSRLGEANCVRRLGDVHRMLDEYALARERYEEALSLYEELLPSDHPYIRDVHINLRTIASAKLLTRLFPRHKPKSASF